GEGRARSAERLAAAGGADVTRRAALAREQAHRLAGRARQGLARAEHARLAEPAARDARAGLALVVARGRRPRALRAHEAGIARADALATAPVGLAAAPALTRRSAAAGERAAAAGLACAGAHGAGRARAAAAVARSITARSGGRRRAGRRTARAAA